MFRQSSRVALIVAAGCFAPESAVSAPQDEGASELAAIDAVAQTVRPARCKPVKTSVVRVTPDPRAEPLCRSSYPGDGSLVDCDVSDPGPKVPDADLRLLHVSEQGGFELPYVVDDKDAYLQRAGNGRHPYFWSAACVKDPRSFEPLGELYGRDREHVYYAENACDPASDDMATADPETFEVLACENAPDWNIARDATHFYLNGRIISASRVEANWGEPHPTGRPPACEETRPRRYRAAPPEEARFDRPRIFPTQYGVDNMNPPPIRYFVADDDESDGFDTYVHDYGDVYVRDSESAWAPLCVRRTDSFEWIGDGYARDGERVYYATRSRLDRTACWTWSSHGDVEDLEFADPKTFEVMRCPTDTGWQIVGRDATHYYIDGNAVVRDAVEQAWGFPRPAD